jgi:hypothetical protein
MLITLAILFGTINIVTLYFHLPRWFRRFCHSNPITTIMLDLGLPLTVLAGMFAAPNLGVVVIALGIGAVFDCFLWAIRIRKRMKYSWRY